jgi:hypothetical protein
MEGLCARPLKEICHLAARLGGVTEVKSLEDEYKFDGENLLGVHLKALFTSGKDGRSVRLCWENP